MAFFDDFKAKAKDFAAVASEKAKDLSDSARTSAAILAEQREIDKNYRVIGEWFVNEYEGDCPDAIADVVAAVKVSKGKIEELRASREKVEDPEQEPVVDIGRACPLCGEVSNGKFCPKCGAPMSGE